MDGTAWAWRFEILRFHIAAVAEQLPAAAMQGPGHNPRESALGGFDTKGPRNWA